VLEINAIACRCVNAKPKRRRHVLSRAAAGDLGLPEGDDTTVAT